MTGPVMPSTAGQPTVPPTTVPPTTAPPAPPPKATPGISGPSVVHPAAVAKDAKQSGASDVAFRQVRSTGSAYEKTAALAKSDATAAAQLNGKYLEFRAACKSFDVAIDAEPHVVWGRGGGRQGVSASETRQAKVDRVVNRVKDPDARFFATAAEVIGPLEAAPKRRSDDHVERIRLVKLANTALAGLHQAAMGRDRDSAARLVALTTPALMSFLQDNNTLWSDGGKDLSRVKDLQSKIQGVSAEGNRAIDLLFSGLDTL
jgi:hypothetical protein